MAVWRVLHEQIVEGRPVQLLATESEANRLYRVKTISADDSPEDLEPGAQGHATDERERMAALMEQGTIVDTEAFAELDDLEHVLTDKLGFTHAAAQQFSTNARADEL